MASLSALVIDAGTQRRILAADTLLVGVGINPSAAGALSIGVATATSIVIGAGGITTSFPGPVALTGGITTVGGTTFTTDATFEGDVTFGNAVSDNVSFVAQVATAMTYDGIAAPAVSPATTGRIYFDSTSNTFKVSENGGAYVDMTTDPAGADGSVQYNNGGVLGGDAAQLLWDDTTNRLHVGGGAPNEKLTVSGVISIAEQAAPTATAAFGKLWTNSAFDARPYFMDDLGQSHNLTLDRFNTLTAGGAITINTDPILPTYNSVALNGDATFSTSNLGNGRSAAIRVVCDGTTRTLTFPAGWTWLGTSPPANLAANDVGWLAITAFGATDSTVVAAWGFQNQPAAVTGSGTANQIAFWSSSSAIGGDTDLTYDSTTNVLTLNTGRFANGTAAAPSIAFQNSTDLGIFRVGAGEMGFSAGGTQRMSLDATDLNITAGLTQSVGAVALTANAASSFTTSAGALTITAAAASTWSSAAALTVSATSANLTLSTVTSGDVIIATPSAASALVVKVTTGRVGIGNSAPTQQLTVGAASEFAVSSGGKIKNYNGAAPLDGQLLIGNTAGVSFDAATITAGTGISVTNGAGTITIATTGASSLDVTSIAQQTLLTGDLVRYVNNAGTPNVQKADSNDTARQGPVGFVVTGVAAAASVTVRITGEASVPAALFDSAPAAANVGQRVFMSITPGQVTLTAPTNTGDVVQRVGILTDGSASPKILVQIGEPITL